MNAVPQVGKADTQTARCPRGRAIIALNPADFLSAHFLKSLTGWLSRAGQFFFYHPINAKDAGYNLFCQVRARHYGSTVKVAQTITLKPNLKAERRAMATPALIFQEIAYQKLIKNGNGNAQPARVK